MSLTPSLVVENSPPLTKASDDSDRIRHGSLPQPASALEVLCQFRLIFSAVKSHFQRVERAVGLGGAQVWALSEIAAHPGQGVGHLAQVLHVRQPTASNMVQALIKRGLIQSDRSDRDRRAVELRLTEKGAHLLAQVPGPASGVLPEALAKLPPAVRAQLSQDLGALIGLMGADPNLAQTPLSEL